MENQKKKSYSSLPSNYVTLAQLQQRWLDQQTQKGEKLQHQQQEEGAIVVPANGTAPTSHRAGDSGAGRREAEAGVGIGDKTADLEGKVAESSSKKMMMQWSRKPEPKVERKGANKGGSKGAIRSDVNGKKSVDWVKVEKEGEQKFRASSSVNAVKEKQNGRMKKVELKGASEEGSKAAIRSEVNGNSVNVAEEVEQKFRASSINTATEKQNGRMRRMDKVASEAGSKSAIGSEVNEKKIVNSAKVEVEVEEKFGGLTANTMKGKQNGRIRRMKKVDQKGAIEGGSKTTIGSEMNEKKSVDSVKVEEQSEQKFGASSVKGKQNGRMKSSEEGLKTTIATEMNEKKSVDSEKVEEQFEQKFGASSVKGKQNWRIRGMKKVVEQKGAGEEAIGSELNGKKSVDSVKVEEEAEQKFGDFRMKGNQNGRMNDDEGFRHSHSQRDGYGSGRDYGNGFYGHRRGGGFDDQQSNHMAQRKKSDKMVWVKKDGGIESESS